METSRVVENGEPVEPVLRGWRFWIRPVVIILYSAVLLIGLPLLSIDLVKNKAKPHTLACFVAGIFLVLTIPISLWTMIHHLIYFTQPELQKPILRILWMVPIYAIDSWFAIKFPSVAIYLDTVRECYEAYVIYNFMAYIFNYLTQEYELAGTLGSKPQVGHLFPFWCLPSWPMGGIFIQRCQQGVLQYTLIRPITTLIAFTCELGGVYHEGEFNVGYAWLWIMIINNLSQIWALYCLMMFYVAAKEELKPIKPVGKFICVKLVVFASFWQGVVIAVIVALINIDVKWGWDTKEQLANGLQDLLICFEMFFASIAHHFTFSYKPYVNVHHNVPWYRSIKNMFDVSDVRSDVTDQVMRVGDSVPWRLKNPKEFFKKKICSKSSNPCETTSQQVNERSNLLQSSSPYTSDSESATDMANVLGYGCGPYNHGGDGDNHDADAHISEHQ